MFRNSVKDGRLIRPAALLGTCGACKWFLHTGPSNSRVGNCRLARGQVSVKGSCLHWEPPKPRTVQQEVAEMVEQMNIELRDEDGDGYILRVAGDVHAQQ